MNANCRLQEPIMSIQIIAPADRTSKILSDLGKRRATILDVSARGERNKVKIIALMYQYIRFIEFFLGS